MTIAQIEAMPADETGHISITEEGITRRFLKCKLLDYLAKQALITPVQQVQLKRPVVVKPAKRRAPSYRTPLVAIHPDGREQQFFSCRAAAAVLNLNKDYISRTLQGKRKDVNGIQFKRLINDI